MAPVFCFKATTFEATTYADCYQHSHIVRLVSYGAAVRMSRDVDDDGREVAVFAAIPATSLHM
jgi:hypothetical protein